MILDLGLGAAAGVSAYLLVMGYNVLPLVVVIGGAYLVWHFVIQRQLVKTGGKGVLVSTTAVGFDDIGGQDAAKKELQEALDFLLYSDRMKALGIRPLKGILLSGPPGTGKTLLAKAAARYTNSAFLAVSGSEFVEMYAGVGAERVRSLFRRARETAKKEKRTSSIIFIDEMDILGAKRGSNISHHEYDQTLNQLLVEMDGLGTDQGSQILVIGATNRADALDEALVRPGRFDRMVKVDLPDKEGRLAILRIHTKNKPLAAGVDLEKIARETFGFSGAHLESVANEAAVFALRAGEKEVKESHLREAVEKVMLGEQLDRKPTAEEMERIAIHESGHALLAEIVRPRSVAQVSVRSRGNALGYVRHYPEDDLYLYTQTMLEEQIMVALAGAMSEEELLGSRSTGAAGDYGQAFNLVEKMLMSGMSSLGVVDLENLGVDKRHEATREIFAVLEDKTRRIIREHRGVLRELAGILRAEETLSGETLRAYLHDVA
ncbi:Peptidase family M41 [Acididesulfobacillus acetoxydans]|uniref:ATP-dependent zinc metalloprotease FtsH 2 n=1 Tax=Acididesulfobacillus acetoxydans TaxID=1561005 RepID=A0A8S0XZH7_9FIRM|nr:AAA family ATPase [Acididesulfobacillus acetoxydans]CAA7602497.1 Peptidase family M41 [Acididesulfobacillus acetoxydans]CEJ05952.1 ATP-dependent zinc metalloprotease FtsH 2 [Acididesulfobacillus acetoxydans]